MFGKRKSEIDDDMVKDPYCGVYFSKKDGVHLNLDGQDLNFCSEECKDKYLEKRQSDNRTTDEHE
ncbi:MAG: hypothetical protein P8012_11285 [Desulfobacterales bacterium]